MEEINVLVLVLAVLSILPSLIFALLGGLAFRQNWAFWYYNFSFASFGSALFLMSFVYWFFCVQVIQAREEGYILFLLPILGLIIGIGAFLLALLPYPFMDFKSAFWTAKPLPSYPLWASVAAMLGFELVWLLLTYVKLPPFRQ